MSSESIIKKSLVSVGAVVSVAGVANAGIVYVDTHSTTLNALGQKWYLNGTGDTCFLSVNLAVGSTSSFSFWLDATPTGDAVSNLAFVSTGSSGSGSGAITYLTNFSAPTVGTNISAMDRLNTGDLLDVRYGNPSTVSTYDFKNFATDRNGYIAFSFTQNSQTQYAWAYIAFDAAFSSMTISEWAYTTAGEQLYVGQTEAVPEPAQAAVGLGLLALGAAGMRRYKKNRKNLKAVA